MGQRRYRRSPAEQIRLFEGVRTTAELAKARRQSEALNYSRLKAEYYILGSTEAHVRYQQLRSAAMTGRLELVDDDGLPGKPGERHAKADNAPAGSGEGPPPPSAFDGLFKPVIRTRSKVD